MKIIETTPYTGKNYERGQTFSFSFRVPEGIPKEEMALVVVLDGLVSSHPEAMEQLAAEGLAPHALVVGIGSGRSNPTLAGGEVRGRRFEEFDFKGREFPDFLVEEFLPWLCETYRIEISDNPDMHMISGGSSGGCSVWNVLWYRNDYFRRGYLSSPSMLAMGAMDEFLSVIRKYETKPMRTYITLGENEPDEYFGSSYCVADSMQRAMKFAGYDCTYEYFPGEDHCCRFFDVESCKKFYSTVWKDWKTQPITAPRNSHRIDKLVKQDSQWEKTDAPLTPHTTVTTAAGTYTVHGSEILFSDNAGTTAVAADGFSCLTAIALSADGWRLYAADRNSRVLTVFSCREDGALIDRGRFGVLHCDTGAKILGAYDICTDRFDRVWAATDSGIQSFRTFGLVDCILTLPCASKIPTDISVFAVEYCRDTGTLYAASAEGVYRRTLNPETYLAEGDQIRWTDYYGE